MRTDHSSTMYLRMLSRSTAKAMSNWHVQPLPFALVSAHGRIERTGVASLTSLAAFIARVRRVVLIMAASDVTLLRMAVPPLSSAKLKAALPSLVEDHLITDPAQCVLSVGPHAAGMRTIAVIERDWLREIVDVIRNFGGQRIFAYAAQSCLPLPASGTAESVSAAITQINNHIDLALRLTEHEGMGLPLLATQAGQHIEFDACLNLQTLAGHRPVELIVPAQQKEQYQHAVDQLPAGSSHIVLIEDNWQTWVAGAEQAEPDLMTGLESVSTQTFNWRIWRWPVWLMALLLSLNIIALYLSWWQLKSEGDAIRASMRRMYQVAFPDDTVIVDPLVQLQQKISAQRLAHGEVASDDFLMLIAILSESLSAAPTNSGNAKNKLVAALNYRQATLEVRFKPGAIPPLASARAFFSSRKLSLTTMPEQDKVVVWQIRNMR
jgi:general secretion pathway protein L